MKSISVFLALLASFSVFATTNDCNHPVKVPMDDNVSMKFCEIPAGTEKDNGVQKDFKSFQIGQFPVTQAQYKALIGNEPWKEIENNEIQGDNYPAVYISYKQIETFIKTLNMLDPTANYRLPTGAEFTFAARAGTSTKYYWGDDLDPMYAYSDVHEVTTCPILALDKKNPGYCANQFGLMHMLGNVWQWTYDDELGALIRGGTQYNTPVVQNSNGGIVVFDRLNKMDPSYDGVSINGITESDFSISFRLVRTPKPSLPSVKTSN